MVNIELNDREISIITTLLEQKVHYGVELGLTREYIALYDKLNAKKIP